MLKIEIDPLQPKVTVVGNVDPQTLIKKLFKLAGKQAEVWNAKGNNNELAANGRKEAKTHEEEKSESGGCDKAKCGDSSSSSSGTSSANYKRCTRSDEVIVKEITAAAAAAGDGDKGANSNEDDHHGKQMNNKIAVPISYSNSVHDHELQLSPVHIPIPIAGTQYHYMAGQVQPPYTVNVQPCYALSSCYVTEAPPPLIPSTKCYAQAQAQAQPQPQPPANFHYPPVQSHPIIFQAPTTRVGDYFSDDNTVGCSVM